MDKNAFKPSAEIGAASKGAYATSKDLGLANDGRFAASQSITESQRDVAKAAAPQQTNADTVGVNPISADMIPPVPPLAVRKQIGPPNIYKFEPTEDVIQSEPVGSGAIQHPFQISDASTGGTAKISVRFGTANDDIPDNIATDLTLTNSTTNYICLNCTLNVAGSITDSDLEVNTTGKPADDNDSAYILIGTVVTGTGTVTTINQAVTHSLRFAACGRTDDGGSPAAVVDRGTYEFWGV